MNDGAVVEARLQRSLEVMRREVLEAVQDKVKTKTTPADVPLFNSSLGRPIQNAIARLRKLLRFS